MPKKKIAPSNILTPEEEAQFTLLNAVAFDIMRVEAPKKGTIPPCWLCMSDGAKQEARSKAVAFLNKEVMPFLPFTEETAEGYLENRRDVLEAGLQAWRHAELTYKNMRRDGNPGAFFAD